MPRYKKEISKLPTTERAALYSEKLPCHWKYPIMYITVGILTLNDRYLTSKILSDSENLLLSKLTLKIRR